MNADIKTLRAALSKMHAYATGQSRDPYMSMPARPDLDADLLLSAALDELGHLRTESALWPKLKRPVLCTGVFPLGTDDHPRIVETSTPLPFGSGRVVQLTFDRRLTSAESAAIHDAFTTPPTLPTVMAVAQLEAERDAANTRCARLEAALLKCEENMRPRGATGQQLRPRTGVLAVLDEPAALAEELHGG